MPLSGPMNLDIEYLFIYISYTQILIPAPFDLSRHDAKLRINLFLKNSKKKVCGDEDIFVTHELI